MLQLGPSHPILIFAYVEQAARGKFFEKRVFEKECSAIVDASSNGVGDDGLNRKVPGLTQAVQIQLVVDDVGKVTVTAQVCHAEIS